MSKDIKVGDILHLEQNEDIPADIVILATGLDYGKCYVETAQLDGY
jgi:phospholipid-translocating ATPase